MTVVGLTGCHWVLSLEGFTVEVQNTDGDKSPPDANPDRPVVPLDTNIEDHRRDKPEPDSRHDIATPDTTTDVTSVLPPCKGSKHNPINAWTGMTLCEGPSGINQDQATGLCNTGWHLCTATDYLTRGGKMQVTSVQSPSYWLAACVIPGQPPLDSTCAGWLPGCPSYCQVGWGCTGGSGVSRKDSDRFPLKGPHPYCYQMGQNDPKYGAYWFALTPTSTTPTGAICCLD